MTDAAARHTIPGSDRQPMPGATAVGPVDPAERFEVSLRLRAARPIEPTASGATQADVLPGQRLYLSRADYARHLGATPQDIAAVGRFAKDHALAVVQADAARRSVVLAGTAADFSRAFDVTLQHYDHPRCRYRGRTGTVSVPAALAGIVEGVFGLDNRPQAEPHFQRRQPAAEDGTGDAAAARATAASPFTPPQLARLYDFPSDLDGSGQCIALIELGGGFRRRDLAAYFGRLGLPVPKVKAVRVDHARNAPGTADGADGEVMLDIEVAAAVAPKATIAVYFAPNTTQGFLDAVTQAIHDPVNKPSVVSISWGSPESNWTGQAMTQFDQAFQAAAALGVTVCCAAGDAGSGDGTSDGQPHVDFPAASPFALGCGGTRLTARAGTIVTETVWNAGPQSATGGGVSGQFPLPAYQQAAQVPPVAGGTQRGRGVPDVAGNADPASGYEVQVDGQQLVIGGTSAVAPLWAGLIAQINQRLAQPVGFLNPLLYGSLAGAVCRDITRGSNGAYAAKAGWDPCTGWGSPDGGKLLKALGG